MSTPDEALARAQAVAARLSDTGATAPAAAERKRKRWGVSDDGGSAAAPAALPGLDVVEKKLKAASEPVQRRVWVKTGDKPPAHFVDYLEGSESDRLGGIVAQYGGDAVKIELKGRGSSKTQALPGMPEEPLHVLIDGPPDKVQEIEAKVDDLLREAEQAPVTTSVQSQPNGTDAQNQLSAESIAARAADALAAAMGTNGATPAAASAEYRPASVAQLIGQNAAVGAAGVYGPGGGTGETFEEQIGVPNGVVGYIIGRGGESITSMQQKSGCRVQIQKEHEMTPGQTQRVITLTASSKESIDICRGIIEGMVQERVRSAGSTAGMGMPSATMGSGASSQAAKLQEAISMGHVHLTVQVPDGDVGLIIGKAGSNIRSIQDRSGANIQIPQVADADNPSVRTVNVTHPHAEGANLAKQLIEDLLKSKPSNQYGGAGSNVTLQVLIPDQDVGMCIGRSGCVIREMQNKSGTRIQIPSQPTPGQTHRVATVTGSQEGCQQVQQMIERIIQDQSSQSVMAGTAPSNYGNAYGQYGQHQQYGGAYGQQAAGGQKDYSAEWAAYYAAQAAQQGGATAAPAASGSGNAAATPTASGTNGDTQPAPDAYYEQFFQYAYHYGEDAARKYYGAWSPPVGTPNPYGTNPALASGGAPAPSPAPAAATTDSSQPAAAQGGGTDTAAIAASMGARDTGVRKQSNLPAWMTKSATG